MVKASAVRLVEINIGERKLELKFDFNGLSLAEKAVSSFRGRWTPITSIIAGSEATIKCLSCGNDVVIGTAQLGVSDMRALIWGAVQHENNPPTLVEVGEWMNFTNIEAISDKIVEAFNAQTPAPEKGDGPVQDPFSMKESTGSKSGPSAGMT